MLTAHHRSAALVEALDGRMPTLEIQAFAVRERNRAFNVRAHGRAEEKPHHDPMIEQNLAEQKPTRQSPKMQTKHGPHLEKRGPNVNTKKGSKAWLGDLLVLFGGGGVLHNLPIY